MRAGGDRGRPGHQHGADSLRLSCHEAVRRPPPTSTVAGPMRRHSIGVNFREVPVQTVAEWMVVAVPLCLGAASPGPSLLMVARTAAARGRARALARLRSLRAEACTAIDR